MGLKEEVSKRIKDEINNDPANRGYAGKTDKEIADLINAPIIVQTVVETTEPSRFLAILSGVPFGPNTVTEQDVADAKVS